MPGSVANAAPSTVMPATLSRGFTRIREYPVLENNYKGGESQRAKLADTSRSGWRLSKRLAPTALATLRSFYEARHGGHQPFYFYDPWETDPLFSWDPTGVDTVGRYTVRFEGGWEQAVTPGRVDVPSLQLVELA